MKIKIKFLGMNRNKGFGSMKKIIYFIFSIICISSKSENFYINKLNNINLNLIQVDTISQLILRNKFYKNNEFKVIFLSNLENETNNFFLTKTIILVKNKSLFATIKLPIANDEVKNFSVTKILETVDGFKILMNWGGGNNIYNVEYFFYYKKNEFYFAKFSRKQYRPNTKVTTKLKKIKPMIPIENFEIINYID